MLSDRSNFFNLANESGCEFHQEGLFRIALSINFLSSRLCSISQRYIDKERTTLLSRIVQDAWLAKPNFSFARFSPALASSSLSESIFCNPSISTNATVAALRSPDVIHRNSTTRIMPSTKTITPETIPIRTRIFHVRRSIFRDISLLQSSICKSSRTFISIPYCAAAPETISIISLVMAAWRTRFMYSVSESIMSEALLVAESMAVMRAACSAATDSVMA